MRPSSYRYSKPQFIFQLAWIPIAIRTLRWATSYHSWLRKIRTFISSFVVKCSHPLNYKSSVDFGIRTLFLRCTDGCFTDKLKPTSCYRSWIRTSIVRVKFWHAAIAPSDIQRGSYGNRTHSNRSTICDVSRYTNEPIVARTRFELVSSQWKCEVLNP